MKKFYNLFLLIAFFVPIISFAQTTVNTTHTNNNGSGSVTFNVQNTNTFDIIITSINALLNTNAANNLQVLYRTTPFVDNATPWDFGVVGAGQNGWVLGGTATLNSNLTNGIVPAISGLNLKVCVCN